MAGLREQKKQETKAAIMGAAITLFGERGYGNTSISALAKAAGIGKGTIYSYFSSKEEILLAFCEEEFACVHQELRQQINPEAPLIEKLILIFMTEFRYVTRNKEFGRTLMRELIFPMEMTVEKSKRLDGQFIDLFVRIFKEAQDKGQLRRDVELTLACGHFYALYLIIVSAWYSGRLQNEEDVRAGLQALFEQALNGLNPLGDTRRYETP